MIEGADALAIFAVNMWRTESLITAMVKIQKYNELYQWKQAEIDPEYASLVKKVQDAELAHIEIACAEHAILSLVTSFETYYRELLQEVLSSRPNYFASKQTKYDNIIQKLINGSSIYTYEHIEDELKLSNRFRYIQFFQDYQIPFLLTKKESDLIDYIYVQRNYFTHNANKRDTKRDRSLQNTPRPVKELQITTEVKRLRTQIKRLIPLIDKRVKETVYK